ncbi:MAG TPA: hypothetical protein VF763_04645 [Candidatus Limnocylindrales bacterium]
MEDRDIDRLLVDAGRRWRDAQAAAIVTGTVRYHPYPERRRRLAPLGAALGFTVALVGGGLLLRTAFTTTGPSVRSEPTSSGSTAALVRPGDTVSATGFVVARAGEPVFICWPGPVAAVGGSEQGPSCGLYRAELQGLDLSAIPSRAEASGVVYTQGEVTLVGTWTGSAIRVSSNPVPAPAAQVNSASCVPPAAGWPSAPPSLTPLEAENAVAALAGQVSSHPAVYSGYWSLDGGGGSAMGVMVVGTTGDPAAVRPTLERAYPWGVCIVRARYSAADLQRAYDALANLPPQTASAAIDPSKDRVSVKMITLTQPLADLLRDYPEAIPEPLVIRR